jgi:hypothetical protein
MKQRAITNEIKMQLFIYGDYYRQREQYSIMKQKFRIWESFYCN